MQQTLEAIETKLTERQKDVLDKALLLLVKSDGALTMSNIAKAASCSKETLYKWFGDRDNFLEILVRWQASKVRVLLLHRDNVDGQTLFFSLEYFARDWLVVLNSQTSIALNRLAISHAASQKSKLGDIVLHNGPFAMARRLKPVLQLGCDCGLLKFDNIDYAFRTFFGLVVRDMQIRKLLGDDLKMSDEQIICEARSATRQFFVLFGTEELQQIKHRQN